MKGDGFLDRAGIRAMAERYVDRQGGKLSGDLASHLTAFGALVKRQVVFEERNWRLSQFEAKEPPP